MFNQTYPGQQYAQPYDYGDGYPKGPEVGLQGSARTSFIKKVYLLLSLQLLLTAIFVLLSMYSLSYKQFVGNSVTIIVASVGLLVIGLVMACCFEAARPFQVPLFVIFTILEAILVSAVTAFTSSKIVALAALMAFALVVVLTIYAFTTNTDFSGCAPYLMIMAVVLMLIGLVSMFIRAPFLQILYSGLAVMLYGVFLIYDTQLVVGRFSSHYSFDDYYLASLALFMDIIQLFLNIMNIFKNT